MIRRICVITGSRADYGLLNSVISGVQKSRNLRLQLLVTGMHLSPEFGLTYREIEEDGHNIDARVEMLLSSDEASGVVKSMGLAMIGFADALDRIRPDIVVILGDRFEILAAASAASVMRIPIAHLHGGEITEGAYDEGIRHAVTKLSHIHFVAAESYRQRVLQLGETPERVHLVGGLGVDAIQRLTLLDREELEAALDFRFGPRNLLITFHPVTLESEKLEVQMIELLTALDLLEDTHLIITLPNADNGGRTIIRMIEAFVEVHPKAKAYSSLGQRRYLSCVRQVDAVVGNSSSGLTEVPSMGVATINIGNRQRGRIKAASVIDCEPECIAISRAIERCYSPEFQQTLVHVENPYGDGGAGERIVNVLETIELSGIIKKSFCDLNLFDPRGKTEVCVET